MDRLLDTECDKTEKIIDTIKIGEAKFEIVEKPETILAGKIIYAKHYRDIDAFNQAIESISEDEKKSIFNLLQQMMLPITDIHLSVNFWLDEKTRAFGFVREVTTEQQPEGIDVYKIPASLYIRAYTDNETAQLIAKEQCEVWELFAYIRNFFITANGFRMADNGAQELSGYNNTYFPTDCIAHGIREIMYAMSVLGYGNQPMCKRAWTFAQQHRLENGKYILTARPSKPYFNIGVKGKENKWITLYMLLAEKYKDGM